MRKKQVIIALLLILSLIGVFTIQPVFADDASVDSLSPAPGEVILLLTVTNTVGKDGGGGPIYGFRIYASGLEELIIEIGSPSGWSYQMIGDMITWSTTSSPIKAKQSTSGFGIRIPQIMIEYWVTWYTLNRRGRILDSDVFSAGF